MWKWFWSDGDLKLENPRKHQSSLQWLGHCFFCACNINVKEKPPLSFKHKQCMSASECFWTGLWREGRAGAFKELKWVLMTFRGDGGSRGCLYSQIMDEWIITPASLWSGNYHGSLAISMARPARPRFMVLHKKRTSASTTRNVLTFVSHFSAQQPRC